jgi:hypothetical protein
MKGRFLERECRRWHILNPSPVFLIISILENYSTKEKSEKKKLINPAFHF